MTLALFPKFCYYSHYNSVLYFIIQFNLLWHIYESKGNFNGVSSLQFYLKSIHYYIVIIFPHVF